MLSKRKNWLLVGLACVEIGYSLAEHTRKLVTLWLSIGRNWLLVGWAYAEIHFYWYWTMFFTLSPFPVPCLTSYVSCLPSSVPCLPSSVPCLTSLFLVSRPLYPILMSHFFVSCLPSSVPFFTSLFLVSHPLFQVSLLCSLSTVLCSQSYVSVPYLPFSFPNLKS